MIVIGLVIGMGIFRTASDSARAAITPSVFFISWIVGGFIALCGALTYAEIGSRYPITGGYYKIFATCYHPSIAFAVNCVILISNASSLSGVALIGSEYLAIDVIKPLMGIDLSELAQSFVAMGAILVFYGINLLGLRMSSTTQNFLFLGFFIAFAIKAPLWPFHTWLPDAASSATPGTSVLLLGVLDKVGTFGMIRYCLTLFPEASKTFTPVIIVLAVISIIYGAILAIGQKDLKRLIAFTSISHFGFITMGIFAMTSQSQSGATLYMFNHGFSTAALFIVGGWMIARRGSSTISDFGGLQRITPVMAWCFFLAGMSSLALPGLSSFVSEFLVLVGTYTRYPVAAIIATVGIILAALYILIPVQRALHGPTTPGNENLPDLNLREKIAIAPVLAAIIALGFYPSPLLNVINPAAVHINSQLGFTDPVPTVEGK